MAFRVTNIQTDIPRLNKELQKFDLHAQQISELQARIGQLESHIGQLRNTRQVLSSNNVTFTWTGGTLTLSWSNGYVQNNSLENFPVVAGSRVVSASTVYWAAWNPLQQSMVISSSLQTVLSGIVVGSPDSSAGNNLVICSVKTGTAGQSGTAGGGGSDSGGVGPSGKQYVNF